METNDIKHPAFLRLPKCGERCALTGLSRSMLNALILPTAANNFMPPVVSHVVKSDLQSTRGVRVIEVRSLLAFINSQMNAEKDTSKSSLLPVHPCLPGHEHV